ncbi:MAG TPA: DMT family transporter [Ferrovaceae bacterium]|nr:DMT family transporter [Ferrovaceae bacterium]
MMNLFPRLGAGWMLVAGVSFSCMGLLVKFGANYFSSAELVFYRSIVGFIFIGMSVLVEKRSLLTPYWPLHIVRSATGLISLWLFFYAISHLPLATAITLNYTSPLFLALLLTVIAREKLNPLLLFVLLLGFVGVVFILKPHINDNQWFAALMGLLSGFGAGVSYLVVRTMGQKGEPEWRVVFYFSAFSSVVMALVMFFPLGNAVPQSWQVVKQHLGILVGVGVAATLGQLTMTRAYRLGKTLLVANLAYATIVISAVMGVIFFKEWLSTGAWVGVAIVISSGISASWLTNKRAME